jgi:putative nucleotidyltransferase with HDIG domain
MIDEAAARAMLDRYGLSETRIRHSEGVAEFAFDLARTIAAKNPALGVDPQKVKIAALLHDIGRSREGHHQINSVAILREEGLDDLAEMVMHGPLYEIMCLSGENNPAYLPTTIENKIVAYADARFRLRPVTLQERIDEVLVRRADEKEKVAAFRMAAPRFFQMEKELMELAR